MTETLTPIEILKSRQNFTDYIEAHSSEITTELLKDYPARELLIICSQLTQNSDGLITLANQLQGNKKAYIFWFVVNEKKELKNIAQNLNSFFDKNFCGIFLIKAFLNNEKIDFECLLKPEIGAKSRYSYNTPAKKLQNEYWQRYSEICDELASDNQVSPRYQHWQYLPMHKAGVCLMLSINTQQKYIGADLVVNSNKYIFEKLYSQKDEIEKELGELEWVNIPGQKSSRIRKAFDYDITDKSGRDEAIKKHIKLAEDFKSVFPKYLL